MKKCKHCEKNIPINSLYFPEYYNILLNLNKYREDKNKMRFFNLILKNLEKNNNIELCECYENLEETTKLYNIYLDKNREFKDTKHEHNQITDNFKFNIVRNKLPEQDFIKFLKNEKMFFSANLKNTKFVDYNELKSLLKTSNESKNLMKKQDIFVIYNFKPEDTKKEFYYYDEVIIEIFKYRNMNNLSSYIFYNEIKRTDSFEKLIQNINDEDVRKFYSDIYSQESEYQLLPSKRKNIPFEIK